MQKWIVTLERDEDGWYIVECPAIPGCVSQGRTEEEALKNIKDAIVECLKVRLQEGLPPSIEIRIGLLVRKAMKGFTEVLPERG